MEYAVNSWGNVTLLFSAGVRQPKPMDKLTLGELLLANRFPPSLFQAYEAPGDGTLKAVPMSLALSEIPEGRNVILQCIRNTDIDALRPNEMETVHHSQDPVAAMFDFQWADEAKSPTHRVHLVDAEGMRDIIFGKIADFLTRQDASLPLVAGISGGGDSNTLVQGMHRYASKQNLDASKITCFTLVMPPIWPESAADRARELCSEAGFEHRVLYPKDMAQLLGMNESPERLWEELSDRYTADLAHFFGTFFINLAGRAICEEVNGSQLLVGYNREDVMAELLFCLVNGRRPMPFPKRRTGSTDVLMPVWDVPKNMLDSCYPHYSEANYSERVDSSAVRRSSIYYMAHCLDALVPQMSMSLMTGTARLMDELGGWQELTPVMGTPLLHTGYGDADEQKKLLELLNRYFPQWQPVTDQAQ
ncbi:hypothetical protein [Streptomyces nigrescens]|uniref:NAD/GMP synthase domain-containing protein n=1 Tax=Streptomyces nigrescens TaxID=1920 RepID=A0ABY7J2Y2_STRNI|nr:hypothetical protein [Streptomyces nigrescens]WAU03986.1 hypothetical protein STRNI_002199 [Streptomyces nigrescens]